MQLKTHPLNQLALIATGCHFFEVHVRADVLLHLAHQLDVDIGLQQRQRDRVDLQAIIRAL
jgi:hypothetical protein